MATGFREERRRLRQRAAELSSGDESGEGEGERRDREMGGGGGRRRWAEEGESGGGKTGGGGGNPRADAALVEDEGDRE